MTNKIQIRGNCQCCGHDQAVVKGNMSKHGYTVDNGWFNGVCGGEYHKPMQVDRAETDRIVKVMKVQIKELKQRVKALKDGSVKPGFIEIRVGYDNVTRKMTYKEIPFAEGDKQQQDEAVRSAIYRTEHRISTGEDFSAYLKRQADHFHGQPVREVVIEKLEPILVGEKRTEQWSNEPTPRILTVTRNEGRRIYFSTVKANGDTVKGWRGAGEWRKLERVA